MAFPVVISDEELGLTRTGRTADRREFAPELEKVFEQHYDFVYRTAYSLTRSAQDAEDITQTIFMRLLAKESGPDLRTNPEPYLDRAAFNLSLNTIQQRKRFLLTDKMELLDRPVGEGNPTTDQLD